MGALDHGVAVVIGGGRGIGAAIARRFASQDAAVGVAAAALLLVGDATGRTGQAINVTAEAETH